LVPSRATYWKKVLGTLRTSRAAAAATSSWRNAGTFVTRSTSPDCSAATRVESSGIGRNTTSRIAGGPRQYASFAVSTSRSSFTHSTKRYAPVPIGVIASSAESVAST
jgi:hypothetical protein